MTEAKTKAQAAEWINDPQFTGSVAAVRGHYRRARPVFETFADLDGCPTTAFAGNGGWYRYRREHELNIDELEVGHRLHRRAYTIDRDFERLVEQLEREGNGDSSWRSVYNIVSWKDREAVYEGAYGTSFDDFEQGDGLAGYGDMRGFPLWVDLDLEDNDDGADGPNYKRRRGTLDAEQRETIEAAIAAYAEEFAELYGVDPEKIAVFDSGGGAYLYGGAAATLPIAERYEDDDGPFGDARALVFRELRARYFAYATGEPVNAGADDYGFEGIEPRVNARIDGAADLLNPDWLQNRNRQSKAPLSIHGDHDIAVTPARSLDDGRVEYVPTLVSEVDDELIEWTAREAAKIVSVPDREELEEMTGAFISRLFPEYAGRGDLELEGWRDVLDTWLGDERDDRRDDAHRRALDERRQRERYEAITLTQDANADPTSADVLRGLRVTPVRKDVFDALERRGIVDVREVLRKYASDVWNTSDRGHEVTFDSSWRGSSSGMSCAVPNGENRFVDNGCDGGGGPAKAYALGTGIMSGGPNAAARSLNGRQWSKAVDGLRSEGYPIPVYIPEQGATSSRGEEYGRTPLWALRKAAVALGIVTPDEFVERESSFEDGGTFKTFPDARTYNETLDALDERGIDHGVERIVPGAAINAGRWVETCAPPLTADAEPLDVNAAREDMRNGRYDRYLDHNGLVMWIDPPGVGKTTTSGQASYNRERRMTTLLPTHANCHEYVLDPSKPDAFHVKGAEQPVGDDCMDAKVRGEDAECSEHGHQSNCPTMCPVYGLSTGDPTRRKFDAIARSHGVEAAHRILGLKSEPWHGAACAWLNQWETARGAERIVTVANYATLDTVIDDRDVIIDDVGDLLDEQTIKLDTLIRAKSACIRLAENGHDDRTNRTLETIAEWIDSLLDAATASDPRAAYAALADDLPEFDTAGEQKKEYVGEAGQYVYVTDVDLSEALAQAKYRYDRAIIGEIARDDWSEAPPGVLDPIYGALATCASLQGDEATARAARIAATVDTSLDECPRCPEPIELANENGRRVCPKCRWDEREDQLTHDETKPARIATGLSTTRGGRVDGFRYRRLPLPEELPAPENVLALDATPQPERLAATFGVHPSTIHSEGAENYAIPNATLTQLIDGAYHLQTLLDSRAAQRKVQKTIDMVDDMHERVVYVCMKGLLDADVIDWPDSVDPERDLMHYYALRGLDHARDADAIVLIGAPHPNEHDLRAEAELLAVGNPWVRPGGEELSTRTADEDDPDDHAGPPVYRKLDYVDQDGDGRAIATKTYTGLVGTLFDARHADELEQAAHRVRPILADEDEHTHIYMLTNVPTRLPVNRLTTFDEFLNPDPLNGAIDVRESALDLLCAMSNASLDGENDETYADGGSGTLQVAGTTAEWYDAAQRVGMDIAERTVRDALARLADAGLVEQGAYVQRRGKIKTLTPLGASVASIRRRRR